jgi:hypothetical protein
MSIAVVRTNQESAKYSENLLTKKSTFKTGNWTSVVTGGGGIINAENESILFNNYQEDTGLTIILTDADGVITSADESMLVTVPRTGIYILSIAVYMESTYNNRVGMFGIYSTNSATGLNIFEFEINNTSDFVYDEYNTYFQTIELTEGDTIDFQFKVGFQGEGNTRFKLGRMKFELDDRGLGLPSRYTLPLDTVLQTTQTIDVPSIGSNSYYAIVVALEGAEIGDYVSMTYPSQIITLGLIVGYPIVTDTDEVSVLIHNHSGGSINPASGNYTFKIIK